VKQFLPIFGWLHIHFDSLNTRKTQFLVGQNPSFQLDVAWFIMILMMFWYLTIIFPWFIMILVGFTFILPSFYPHFCWTPPHFFANTRRTLCAIRAWLQCCVTVPVFLWTRMVRNAEWGVRTKMDGL
jgi:hypothetical protein